MSFAKVFSAQTSLLNAHIIDIEVDLSRGLHSFSIVGLPDKAVEEARDRIGAAIKNSGFKSPKSKNEKVVISLAPADIKKEGPLFDLGMAIAYLAAAGEMVFSFEKYLFIGELALDGKIRKVSGVLPLIRKAKREGFEAVFVPEENKEEAALIEGINVLPAKTLLDTINHLNSTHEFSISPQVKTPLQSEARPTEIGFEDIRSQESAKRGLEIAAAGGHNVAMYGPPGTGKTMLAKAFAGILPSLSFEETLDVTGIHSVAGALRESFIKHPPFRSPHHTSSYVALVGGGAIPRPGEVTLAHKGVLFLDEFPEFERRVLEALRQPLEDKIVSVSRAKGSAHFPADFILIAAMNPCPCGNFGFKGKECICPPGVMERYQRKLSGPIIERIDIWLEVPRIEHEKLSEKFLAEASEKIRERVIRAREKQEERFKNSSSFKTNGSMNVKDLVRMVTLNDEAKSILNASAERLSFSPRVYHKVIKVARSIADLDESEGVDVKHILEAIQYRPKKQ